MSAQDLLAKARRAALEANVLKAFETALARHSEEHGAGKRKR